MAAAASRQREDEMNTPAEATALKATEVDLNPQLLERYGCGPIRFSGTSDGLYDRHLLFDDIVEPSAARAREQFEAVARSVRDVLSQRWLRTEQTYRHANPKRVYYISMEFLIGRSLANNVTNLLLDQVVKEVAGRKSLDWLRRGRTGAGCGSRQRRARAPRGVLSRFDGDDAAAGDGLRSSLRYGIFRQSLENGWQLERPDNWLRYPDPWEVARLQEQVEVEAQLRFRSPRRKPASSSRPAIQVDRGAV